MTDEVTEEPEVSLTLEQLNNELKAIKTFYWEQIERLEQRIENHEGLIAIMVQGYAELAATSEAILEVLSSDLETKDALTKALKNSKEKFLEVLNNDLNINNEQNK